MKESKFIELLNLYIDHEINTADAALLEAEVQRNPHRRQIYREYCQIQKACTQLADQFRTDAPEPTVEPARVIEAFPRRRFASIGYVGGLAAAACVAVAVVSWNRSGNTTRVPATPAPIAITAPAKPALVAARPTLQPAFGGLVRESTRESRLFSSADYTQLDWMNDVRLQRVSLEQLRFETKPTLQATDYLLRERRATPTQAEMTAFRFQK